MLEVVLGQMAIGVCKEIDTALKVLLFDSNLDGHHAEYASYLARYLLEAGDNVTFATPADVTASERLQDLIPSLHVERMMADGRRDRMTRLGRVAKYHRMIRRCGHLAESQAFDIVHHLYLDGAELAWLRTPRRSDRSWATFASRFTMEFPAEPEVKAKATGPKQRLAGQAVAIAKRRALRNIVASLRLDGIFVHSARARGALRELLGPHTPAGVVTSIPDPAPPLNTVPQFEARARLRLPPDGPILLFFGGLRRDKGPDLFLRALAAVPGRWTALVAGQPLSVPEEEVHELVAALPDPSRVILRLGVIPDAEVDAYFASADAIVLPYRESQGTIPASSGILMRAAAAARPVRRD